MIHLKRKIHEILTESAMINKFPADERGQYIDVVVDDDQVGITPIREGSLIRKGEKSSWK